MGKCNYYGRENAILMELQKLSNRQLVSYVIALNKVSTVKINMHCIYSAVVQSDYLLRSLKKVIVTCLNCYHQNFTFRRFWSR